MLSDIATIIKRAKEVELIMCACANNSEVSPTVAALKRNILAVEPPELIRTGTPVSKAKSAVVTRTINLVKEINQNVTIMCGAGIKRRRRSLSPKSRNKRSIVRQWHSQSKRTIQGSVRVAKALRHAPHCEGN